MTGTAIEKELVVTRVFDAPREQLWRAWAQPDQFSKWWGPKDFTAPHISIDFRVGGNYLYCMTGAGPDGVVRDYWNAGEYLEIVPMEKIVANMSFADEHGEMVPAWHYGLPGEWPDVILLTATFEELGGGKTRLTVKEEGIPDVMIGMARMGWEQSLDKLAESLKR